MQLFFGESFFYELWMMMLNGASSLTVRPSYLTLFLAALQGLAPVDPTRIPLPQASSNTGSVYLETTSNGQVRRTASNRNTLSSLLLHRHGCPFLRLHTPSRRSGLQLSLAETPDVSEHGPPPPSVFPPEKVGAPPGRQQHRRRRRNQAVDSSDPLCIHSQRGRCSPGQDEQPPEAEPDPSEQSHAIAKETITSTSDDPFNVVQTPGEAASPRSVGSEKALTKKRIAAEGDEHV